MSPKRRDCSRPRAASPYHRGSTSFSHRGRERPGGGVRLRYQLICTTVPQRRCVFFVLCTSPPTPTSTDTTRVCPGPSQTAGQQDRSSNREQEQHDPSCRDEQCQRKPVHARQSSCEACLLSVICLVCQDVKTMVDIVCVGD